jgi:glutaredoxin-like protein NrdH
MYMYWTDVGGKNRGDIEFYALSTCGWCAKTKKLLDELGVRYKYVYVDLLFAWEQQQVLHVMEQWNPHRSFPTVVINGEVSVVGYKPDEIKEALKLGRE